MLEFLHEPPARRDVSEPSQIEKDGCQSQISVESQAVAATCEGMGGTLGGPVY